MIDSKKWGGLVILFTVTVSAVKPPGYIKPPSPIDKDPPKYKYSYEIAIGADGTSQGKLETRNGEYAQGQYYVSLPEKGASSQVQYFADDWGYHPLFQYSTSDAHSKVSAQFAFGEQAVKALKDGKQIGGNSNRAQDPQSNSQQFTVIPSAMAQPLIQQYVLQPQSTGPLILPIVYAQQYQAQSNVPVQHYDQSSISDPKHSHNQNIYIQDIGSNQVAIDEEKYGEKNLSLPNNQIQKGIQNVFIIHDDKNSNLQNTIDVNRESDRGLIEVMNEQNLGSYGNRIFEKRPETNVNINSNGYSKLVQNTQNLVTGADVLKINSAVEYSVDVGNQLNKVTPQQFDNSAYAGTTQSISTSAATSQSRLSQPIVVAEFGSNDYQTASESYNLVSSTAQYHGPQSKVKQNKSDYYSTTQNTIETEVSTSHNINPTEPSLVITPRPVSNKFLAPITAALRIQNSGEKIENLITTDCDPEIKEKTQTTFEIQKSIPYYIGKFEYYDSRGQLEKISEQSHLTSFQNEAQETVPATIEYQKVESIAGDANNFESKKIEQEADQQADVSQHNVQPVQQIPVVIPVEKIVEKEVRVPAPYPVEITKLVEMPIEVPKYIERPYPVPIEVPIEIKVPYPVEKEVQVPVAVEKLVEKPVHITKYIDRPYPVPQPYPVEVEKVVEKQVAVPVTKYINKPYPVEVKVPQPVPYPVEKIVEKTKFVDKPYPVAVPVQVPVEVTKYVDKPYPVEKIVEKPIHIPVPVEKIIEKPVTQFIEKPYRVNVEVPVPHPVAVPIEVPKPYPVEVTKIVEKPYPQPYPVPVPHPIAVPVTKLVSVPVEIPKYIDRIIDRPVPIKQYVDRPYPIYLPIQKQEKHHNHGIHFTGKHQTSVFSYAPSYQLPLPKYIASYSKQPVAQYSALIHSFAALKHNNNQEYYGPVPPRAIYHSYVIPKSRRNASPKPINRQNFGKNLRIEYGFKPPMVPSVETDEHGTPLKKDDQ